MRGTSPSHKPNLRRDHAPLGAVAETMLGHAFDERLRLMNWLSETDKRELTILECGAGTAIPTIRSFGERLQKPGATLVRINLRENEGPRGTLALDLSARDALLQIEQTTN